MTLASQQGQDRRIRKRGLFHVHKSKWSGLAMPSICKANDLGIQLNCHLWRHGFRRM